MHFLNSHLVTCMKCKILTTALLCVSMMLASCMPALNPNNPRCATCGGDGHFWQLNRNSLTGGVYRTTVECEDCAGTGEEGYGVKAQRAKILQSLLILPVLLGVGAAVAKHRN